MRARCGARAPLRRAAGLAIGDQTPVGALGGQGQLDSGFKVVVDHSPAHPTVAHGVKEYGVRCV